MHRVVTGVRGIKLRDGDIAVDMGIVDDSIDAPFHHRKGIRKAHKL